MNTQTTPTIEELTAENVSLRQQLAERDAAGQQLTSQNASLSQQLAERDAANRQLTAENASLSQRLAERDAADQQLSADESIIRQKTALGLSREQASAVIQRQKDWDRAKAEGAGNEVAS